MKDKKLKMAKNRYFRQETMFFVLMIFFSSPSYTYGKSPAGIYKECVAWSLEIQTGKHSERVDGRLKASRKGGRKAMVFFRKELGDCMKRTSEEYCQYCYGQKLTGLLDEN